MPSNSHAQIGTSIATKKLGGKHVLLGTSATESSRPETIGAGSHAVKNSGGAKYAKRVEFSAAILCYAIFSLACAGNVLCTPSGYADRLPIGSQRKTSLTTTCCARVGTPFRTDHNVLHRFSGAQLGC